MIKSLFSLLLFAVMALAQPTAPGDTAQNVRFAGGTKTAGYCLVWDAYGRATSATCGAGGGEVNAGANLGSGSVIYTGKSGVNLQFRSFTVGSNKLSVTQNTNDLAFDVIPANILLSSLGGSLNLSQITQGGATVGQLLQWNGTTWIPASVSGGGGPANTDALAEGSTNLYSTTGRIRAALSVTGILSYNNGTGVFSCSNCADITSSYSNPSWISALAYSKITGVPSFQLTSEKAAALGYASLDSSTLVPRAQLGTGTPNSTNFLRGDGTWTNPAGSVNTLLSGASVGTRPGLNFIPGTDIDLTITDDAGNNRVNATIGMNLNLASSLTMKMARTSGTVLTFNTGASPTNPHNVRIGSLKYGVTAASTATITAGTGSGNAYYYTSSAGTLTLGHNTSNTISNSGTGITIVGGISAYPAGSIPHYSIDVVSGAWGTSITDDRAPYSVAPDITSTGGTVAITKTLGGVNLEASGYATVAEEGSSLTQRSILNFIGVSMTCVDNAGATRTDCTLSAGGGSPGGSGTELQYRSGASTFGAVTGSSTSGGNITIVGSGTFGANGRALITQNGAGTGVLTLTDPSLNSVQFGAYAGIVSGATAYIGFSNTTQRVVFPDTFGMQLKTASKPSCVAADRGTIFYVAGGAGVLDTLEICRKDAADAYAWVSLF